MNTDLWLTQTLRLIIDQRGTLSSEMLDTAETVAKYLTRMNISPMPQLAFDEDGKPHFAAFVGEFYLSLSVDNPGRITFFAVLQDEEFFAANVSIDSNHVPYEMAALLDKISD